MGNNMKDSIRKIQRDYIHVTKNKIYIMAYYAAQSTLNFSTTYGTEGGILWIAI